MRDISNHPDETRSQRDQQLEDDNWARLPLQADGSVEFSNIRVTSTFYNNFVTMSEPLAWSPLAESMVDSCCLLHHHGYVVGRGGQVSGQAYQFFEDSTRAAISVFLY